VRRRSDRKGRLQHWQSPRSRRPPRGRSASPILHGRDASIGLCVRPWPFPDWRPLRGHSNASCRQASRGLRTTQFAKLVKFSYLWLWQSFSYNGGPMAGRFPRELTIRQLRALAAVHRDRSVTAAAKHLHLTQPAVTLQIRNLQALAGLPLIQRTSDGMLLTDAGR